MYTCVLVRTSYAKTWRNLHVLNRIACRSRRDRDLEVSRKELIQPAEKLELVLGREIRPIYSVGVSPGRWQLAARLHDPR